MSPNDLEYGSKIVRALLSTFAHSSIVPPSLGSQTSIPFPSQKPVSSSLFFPLLPSYVPTSRTLKTYCPLQLRRVDAKALLPPNEAGVNREVDLEHSSAEELVTWISTLVVCFRNNSR